MQIVARKTLKPFWEKHPDARTALVVWYSRVDEASWAGPQDVKEMFGAVDFVGDNRAIFNIGGNRYRLIVHISYRFKSVLIKFVGTHKDYDDLDPETV